MASLTRFVFNQFRHARRYNKILRVLVKYGFQDYVAHLDKKRSLLRKFIPKRRVQKFESMTRWEKMRHVAEELGPTFIKLGQILSNRPDLIPQELVEEFEKLQDGVPPFPSKKAVAIVEQEFGKPVDQIFRDFDPQPIASASMAQVHKALTRDGKDIVLKIQRPEIRAIISEDIKIMYDIAEMLSNRIPSFRSYDPVGIVRSFEKSIYEELDFVHESVNMRRFNYNFRDDDMVRGPEVMDDFCTPRVLAMEFVAGTKISKMDQLESHGLSKKILAKRLLDSFFTQVFRDGYFHADPHPGNLLAKEGNKLCYLDFGMMGNLLKKDMEHLGNLIISMEQVDVNGVLMAIQLLTRKGFSRDQKQLEYDTNELLNRYAYMPHFENHLSEILLDLTKILVKHGLVIPADFFLLIRAMFSVEGIARKLDPDIVILDTVRPHIIGMIGRQRNPLAFGQRMVKSVYDLGSYLQEFPQDLRQTMKMIKSGHVKVDLEHKGIDPMIYTFNRITRQMVAAIISGSLIVGSSMIVTSDLPPNWESFRMAGFVGFALAGVIALGMLFNLMKEDKGH